jgi:hypothetical protein
VIAEIYSLFTGRSEEGIMAVPRDFEESHAIRDLRVVVADVPWSLYRLIDDARGPDCGVPKL